MSSDTVQMTIRSSAGKGPQALQNGHGNNPRRVKKVRPAPLQPEAYEGEIRNARVLAILMEFPDFPRNSILPGETDMYYEDYTPQHYADLLFSPEGFSGPGGENLLSMQQFYWHQSGNSYSVQGAVAGWYMAGRPAAYYGNNQSGDPHALVREALAMAAADPTINLSHFDIEDRYDLDADGNYWEPDGLVDHLMIFHAAVGEEAGGGRLGEDAIWSHRWNLGSVLPIPGSRAGVNYWGEHMPMAAYDYTIQPADAAAGIVSHEYGHDLGLPDEYDTQYTGLGEPVSYWSVMSSGSWAGTIPGAEPTGFSPWAKEFLQHNHGGNWLRGTTVALEDIPVQGIELLLDKAASKGSNNDALRIDLPRKKVVTTVPTSGEYAYFSGSGNLLQSSMLVPVDLSRATSASVSFRAWYDTERDWDYAFVAVYNAGGLTPIPGNITTETNPNGTNPGWGITGASGGWVDAQFDLSAYAGQQFYLVFYYLTDDTVANPGFYADDIAVTIDGTIVLVDDAETGGVFGLTGFTRDPGYKLHDHYYLLEWRTHRGVDRGLAHINMAGELMQFDQGLLVWYVDNSYDNNWVGLHPGNGFLGVVDADQHPTVRNDSVVASTRYQVRDAPFGIHKLFDDSADYRNGAVPDAGRAITPYGLKVRVVSQSDDRSVGKVLLYR